MVTKTFKFQTNIAITVGENIIATIKMRNNFCYPLEMKKLISLLKFLYEFCRLVNVFFSVLLPM